MVPVASARAEGRLCLWRSETPLTYSSRFRGSQDACVFPFQRDPHEAVMFVLPNWGPKLWYSALENLRTQKKLQTPQEISKWCQGALLLQDKLNPCKEAWLKTGLLSRIEGK